MKKVLVCILVIAMVMSLALPASAAHFSPSAFVKDLIPIVSKAFSLIIQIHSVEDILELSEEIQALMAEAKALLKAACPEGFAVKYFFYAEVIGNEGPVSASFEPIKHNEIMFKQYADGSWRELDHIVNKDNTITVNDIVSGPMAVFTK